MSEIDALQTLPVDAGTETGFVCRDQYTCGWMFTCSATDDGKCQNSCSTTQF